MNLLHLFDLSLIARRDRIGLEWGGAEFTFGQIEERSNRLANVLRARGLTKGDRLLLALPLFHIHALGNGLHCWLGTGCRMRLLERFDYRTAIDEFRQFHPSLFFGVPTVYVRLLDTPVAVARDIGDRMRLFVS